MKPWYKTLELAPAPNQAGVERERRLMAEAVENRVENGDCWDEAVDAWFEKNRDALYDAFKTFVVEHKLERHAPRLLNSEDPVFRDRHFRCLESWFRARGNLAMDAMTDYVNTDDEVMEACEKIQADIVRGEEEGHALDATLSRDGVD